MPFALGADVAVAGDGTWGPRSTISVDVFQPERRSC